MIIKKNISFLILLTLLLQLSSIAQVENNPPMREVISSGGATSGASFTWGTLDYTVGEVMVWTYSPGITPLNVKVLTQGFHQPNTANSSLDANVIFSNTSCIGANNGSASLNIFSATGPVTYYWLPPLNDSSANVANLTPGVYYFQVDDGNFTVNESVVIGETQIDCAEELVFYNGITPNGDLNNDSWIVEGLELIKDNTVTIFNRWGNIVWSAKGYDNVSDNKVWKGKNQTGSELPDATYFYVIDANNKVYKGWIELTH
jgi:gliding motility-associated-like protein